MTREAVSSLPLFVLCLMRRCFMQNSVLSHLQPHKVWHYFEEICQIPHGSGNEAALAAYVEQFAKEKGLYVYRDDTHNVFIRLPAEAGYEYIPPVILQGHLDMVCEKDSDSTHDFLTNGLELFIEDDKVGAKGTTLGGDDGIAVAMMMALLDTPPSPHPTIECLFTVSEETGLEGAHAFDPSAVEGGVLATTMINLDSECESVVTAGCAGGMRTDITLPVVARDFDGVAVTVALAGFSGGHSGVEIHEGHTNAIKALGELLSVTMQDGDVDVLLCDIGGGGKDNAIPRDAMATLALQTQDVEVAHTFCSAVLQVAEVLRNTPNVISADKAFTCSAEICQPPLYMMEQGTREVLSLVNLVRDGVLAMNAHVTGMVAYSRNMGIIKTLCDEEGRPTGVRCSFSTRSACEAHLDGAERELSLLAQTCARGEELPTVRHHARYPGWDYAPSSPIRTLWLKKAQELYGVTPKEEAIHAGLECGILLSKMPKLDIISVGPDMWDIHTPRERLGISSTARLYDLLCHVIVAYCQA